LKNTTKYNKMGFKKGHSGNPEGKPKGAKNKVTIALKERVTLLIENNFEKIEADINKLEPKERVQAIIKLMEFVIPRQFKQDGKLDVDFPNEKKIYISIDGKDIDLSK